MRLLCFIVNLNSDYLLIINVNNFNDRSIVIVKLIYMCVYTLFHYS